MYESAFHAQDAAAGVDGHARGVQLSALLVGRDEVLAAILGPLHRLAQLHGRPRHQHFLGEEQHDLGAEATTHVRGDDFDLELRQAEHVGQTVLDGQWRLRRIPHGQRLLQRVEHGHHAARLDGAAARALDEQVLLEHVRRLMESAFGIADDLLQTGGDVARHVVVHQRLAWLERDAKVDHRRERFPLDVDQADGVLGHVAIFGDDHGDRLADVAHLALRQGALSAAVRQTRVRYD